MFRLSGIFSITAAALCGVLLFWTSQSVQRAERDLYDKSQSVSQEQDALRVLSTEWDYLNRPERLENLTRNNLDLDAVHAKQESFVDKIDKIPEPIIPVIPQMKPKNLMQYVSTQAKQKPAVKAVTPKIMNTPSEDSFHDVLKHVTAEGGE